MGNNTPYAECQVILLDPQQPLQTHSFASGLMKGGASVFISYFIASAVAFKVG